MYISTFFTDGGVPKTSLSPTITIRKLVTGAIVVNADPMSEVGNGWYKYDFVSFDPLVEYVIVCDGGATLANPERYTAASNDNFDVVVDLKRSLGLMHENIYIDNPVYDTDNNLVSARVRIYSDPASVGTGADVIGTYEITSVPSGAGMFTTWKQIKL